MLSLLALHLVRSLHLLGMAVVPLALSPEPLPPANPVFSATVAVIVLGAILYGAVRIRAAVPGRAARAAGALAWIAVAMALGAALLSSGEGAPLARGVPFVAIPVWAALAAAAVALSTRLLGPRAEGKAIPIVVVVLGVGALDLAYAAPLLASPDRMWREALRRDPGHEAALAALTRPLIRDHRYDDARKIADDCLVEHPAACGCLDARVAVALARVEDHCFTPAPDACACVSGAALASLRNDALAQATAQGYAAISACPDRAASRAIYAEALALRGDVAAAQREADAARALGGEEGRARYAGALALQIQERYADAAAEIDRAVAAGAGRDAKLLGGALALLRDDLDAADRFISPLVAADPRDAAATYDLALVADRRGRYNPAREGYLRAIALDPCNASARLNLAYLTWKAGIKDEARHHARKFAELAAPDDPRVEELGRMVGVKLR